MTKPAKPSAGKAKGPGVAGPDSKPKKKSTYKLAASVPEQLVGSVAELEQKRKEISAQLKDVERKIYDLETKYLEKSSQQGNALKGYESLLLGKDANKRSQLKPEDRIFSGSSLTGAAHLCSKT